MNAPAEKQNIHEYLAEFDDIPGTRVFTAARARKGCVLKARCRSSGGTGASRSSSMRTKPPSGKAANTNSVDDPLGCQRNKGLPNPMENRSTFTPHATATR